ncbi:MAG TPA: nucleotidyltransferase, partial [Candidatus Bathyarchaeia archaeon]
MPIPESQLETWTHQGATTTAKATHEAIRRALAAESSPIKDKDCDIYLQGSYKNDTNIRGDSDVDIVVQLNSTFDPNLASLKADQVRAFHETYSNATYLWSHFRADVLAALRASLGSGNVQEGNKSLKVAAASGRLPSDVVPCLLHRVYVDFHSVADQRYVEGIVFYTLRE